MNTFSPLISSIITVLMCVILFAPGHALANHESGLKTPAVSAEELGELYLPSDDSMAEVMSVIESAKKSNKLACRGNNDPSN